MLQCAQNSFGRDHVDSLHYKQETAVTLFHQAKYQEAVALQEEVVDAFARLSPTQSYAYLKAMIYLVSLLEKSGRLEEAERMWKTVSEEMDRLYTGVFFGRNYR